MTDHLTEDDLAVAALMGRYIERREHHATPCVHDLLAAAAEFGDSAVETLRVLIACYEAMRATDADGHDPTRHGGRTGQIRSTP
jgi:hypothetical protein